MKKFISLVAAAAMVMSTLPSFSAFADESDTTTVSAVRTMYFNNGDECKETDGDNILIATNGVEGWQSATSFTDEDGTVTEQASNLVGTGFASPRNAVVAFELPDIDYDKLVEATFSITVKNVKQVTSGERIAVYGNSLKESWSVGTTARDALGQNGPISLGLEMLGFTTAIQTGNQTAESASNETITLSSQKLVSYLKQLKTDGYTEVTFRLANSLGGIRFYDAKQTNKPTLTLTTGDAATVTIKTTLADGSSFGVEDKTVAWIAGREYTHQAVPESIEVDGTYYIYNSEKSTLTITPKSGEENVITLVYDKYEGSGLTGDVISEEGATCWFADPRSLTVKSEDGTVNMTYIGYIDVHGSVKATQYNNLTGEYDEILVRSNFQPDDHNNPTFLELPDHRILIIYSRHTDERCFYYRVSKQPYDITTFGEEKYIATTAATTYPNPFILSDDPDHIYLCWRGVNWHPTIGRLTMPDENGDMTLELEKQIVQSTGARPYAKYTSNGKDEIWITYTTGHPDNEDPNWLYFNKININTLDVTDISGNVLSNVNDGTLSVGKNDASRAFAVDTASFGNTRDWVWEIVNDNGTPVIAMVKISSGKGSHDYWVAYYTGSAWAFTDLPDDPSQNTTMHTSNTEYCYSGGMTIDKDDPHNVYVSMPVNGVFGKVFEIVKFTLSDDYSTVTGTEYITENSIENNVRPYISNGSSEGDLRLTWMNGYYQYWMVKNSYPQGFPTRMMTITDMPEQTVENTLSGGGDVYNVSSDSISAAAPQSKAFTISAELLQSDLSIGGTLLKSGNLEITLEKQTVDPNYDYAAVAPNVKAGDKSQKSDNLFSNSDWFTSVSGTNGDKGVNSMGWINYTVTYDGTNLVTYVNGLIDANLQDVDVTLDETMELGGISGIIANVRTADTALTQAEVKASLDEFDESTVKTVDTINLEETENLTHDIILPTTAYNGSAIAWASSDTAVVTDNGAVIRDSEAHSVTLTATVDGESKDFAVTIAAKKNVNENLIFKYDFSKTEATEDGKTLIKDVSGNGLDGELYGTAANLADGKLDLSANTSDGWDNNGYVNVPYDILDGVRSYTVIQKVKGGSSKHPRLYDFGTSAYNSVFTRADVFSAGIKNSSTQLVDASTTPVPADKESWIVTSYSAATGETKIYLDGTLVADATTITHEAYTAAGGTTRNYIGRAQWWDSDSSTRADNQDFNGTIDNFMFFNAALTEDEIALMTSETEPEKPALEVASCAYDATAAKITASITVNEADEAEKTALVAVYSGDKLVKTISVKQALAEVGTTTLEFDVSTVEAGEYTYKLLVLDSLEKMIPQVEAYADGMIVPAAAE